MEYNHYHLCYVYIPAFKGVSNIEICVDPHYHCHYDKDANKLIINKNKDLPDDFWGRGIHSLAAIVGNNGVGKSTVVELILKVITSGVGDKDIDCILVYESRQGLFVYSKNKIKIPNNADIVDHPQNICCLYYSGQFIPGLSLDNLRLGELSGGYNISDGYLLYRDVQNYSITDYLHNSLSFFDTVYQYNAKNHARICRLLADKDLNDRIKNYCLPKYIIIKENKSGFYAYNDYLSRARLNDSVKPLALRNITKHRNNKDIYLASLIYFNFLNIIFNQSHYDINNHYVDCLKQWQDYFNDSVPILEQFEKFVELNIDNGQIYFYLKNIYLALSALDNLASFQPTFQSGYYYLSVSDDYDKILQLTDIVEKSGYLVAQIFDISYAQDLYTDTVLSSGEQHLLDLFSRLYYAIKIDTDKFCNLEAPALLILDEAEHAFHPEWQRKYINLLLEFLSILGKDSKMRFQILITTHSPILLSDIPSGCITFLKKENDITQNVHPDMGGTFASNVFEQYKNSFFMSEGLIGEFARQKIESIVKRIKDLETSRSSISEWNALRKEVNIIGDTRIRNYLLQQIPLDDCIEDKIAYYERKIKELKKRLEAHE